jgi:Pyruvate/2-oxoacid:ferredoxin oxidoreductase delta subunit
MSRRKIVRIDEERCNGCGLCAQACAESAIAIVDGKAKLVSDVYCDGLGACLGKCPQDAITIEEREADAFDDGAVKERQADLAAKEAAPATLPCGCPGTAVRSLNPLSAGAGCPGSQVKARDVPRAAGGTAGSAGPSQLSHWPVQLKLVPPHAPFLAGADLLVAADCTAFALGDIHRRYIAGRAVLVGCPKLDDIAFYRSRLADIFRQARPASVTVLRMEVPCCAGLAEAARAARDEVDPNLPLEVHTVALDGGKIEVAMAV